MFSKQTKRVNETRNKHCIPCLVWPVVMLPLNPKHDNQIERYSSIWKTYLRVYFHTSMPQFNPSNSVICYNFICWEPIRWSYYKTVSIQAKKIKSSRPRAECYGRGEALLVYLSKGSPSISILEGTQPLADCFPSQEGMLWILRR